MDIIRIISTYDICQAQVDKYSYRSDINKNHYNLYILRYVDTFEEEQLVNIDEVKQNIENIEG